MNVARQIGMVATDGIIATNNLESARRRAWNRFRQDPARPNVAESIVEMEQFAAEYLGDFEALDRLDELSSDLARAEGRSARSALVRAQTASMAHRFREARDNLAEARALGASPASCNRLQLSISQACGMELDDVLVERRAAAATSQSLEDLVPLGSLLADLGEYDEADRTFQQALEHFYGVSPFAIAWTCFQLGVLWGELVTEPETERAAAWYGKALEYVPGYVKARVHLAELEIRCGRYAQAEALLAAALASTDPEVGWRLADALISAGRHEEGKARLEAARAAFEALLERHPLAFSDHAAAFYAGSGADPQRAFELAAINVANRPTLRAFEQVYATALGAGNKSAAAQLASEASQRHGSLAAFRLSPLASAGALEETSR